MIYGQEYTFKQIKDAAIQYSQNHEHESALEILIKYKNQNLSDHRIYYEIAESYINLKQNNNAINTYLECLEELPDQKIRIHYKIGSLYSTIFNYSKCVEYLKPINNKEISSEYPEINKLLGQSYFMLLDYEMAIEYLRKYIKYNHKEEDIYQNLSSAYKKTGKRNYAKAFGELNNLVKNNSVFKKDEFLYKKGLILFKYKKYKDALQHNFLKIYKNRKKEYKLNFNIALSYILIDEYNEAIYYINKAVTLYEKKFSLKRKLLKLLKLDKIGAKYNLVYTLALFLNNEKENSQKRLEIITKYNKTIYEKYKYDYLKGKKSILYKELKDLWEY